MSEMCDRVDAFLDGELSEEEAAAFRLHLGTCDRCAKDLAELAMLDALGKKHAAALRDTPKAAVVTATLVVAAAAGYALLARSPSPPPEQPIALLDGTTRPIEARIAYPEADRYRPYDVARAGGGASGEHVSLQALAQLEQKSDWAGLAAGLLLSGERTRAAATLDRATASPAIEIARAVIAFENGRLEDALDRLDAIPADGPNGAQAAWNKGLVLRELHLPLGAAESFDKVAALGEPGWSGEARARAKAIRDEDESHDASWQAAKAAGLAMVNTGALPPDDTVRAYPSLVRQHLYHALRAARSAESVLAFAPLAITLDGGDANGALVRYAKRMAEGDFKRRAPFSESYARLVASRVTFGGDDAIDKYLAQLRASHEDDLVFGVLEFTERAGAPGELTRIADARSEPWMKLVAEAATARGEAQEGAFASAERRLRASIATCSSLRFDYLCTKLELQLAELLTRLYRTTEAAAIVEAVLPRSSVVARDVLQRLELTMGDIARLRTAFPLMKAYLHESVLRAPDHCESKRNVAEKLAEERLGALDPRGARMALDQGPRCGRPITPERAYVLSSLARMGERDAELATLESDIEAAKRYFPPGDVAQLDAFAGHYALQTDPARGTTILERAVVEAQRLAEGDSAAKVAGAFAQLTLAIEAARAGRGVEAVSHLAADAHVTGEPRCALAVAVDFERAFSAAVDANGVATIHYDDKVAIPAIDPATLVPEAVRQRLAGCSDVQVFAPAPVHGTPALLPAEVAWSYRIGTKAASGAAVTPHRLFVSDVEPPPSLHLPRLSRWGDAPSTDSSTVWLHGASATPSSVLAALTTATEVEIHAHGLVDLGADDASVIVLSPEASGRYALTAGELRASHLAGHPLVVLGACDAAHVAPYYHEPWSLPLALMQAGARAVFASPAPVRDAEAGPFFAAVLARVRSGATPAQALRDVRVVSLQTGDSRWLRNVLVFD